MTIYISKHRLSTGGVANYFDTIDNPMVNIDWFAVERVLEFPRFVEENTDRVNPLTYIAGDFKVKCALLSSQTSNLGYNIYDFFFSDTYLDNKYTCIVFEPDAKYGGFIDLDTIDVDKTNEGYSLEFAVKSADQELLDYFKMNLLGWGSASVTSKIPFDTYMQKWSGSSGDDKLFPQSSRYEIVNNLSITSKVGWMPVLSAPLMNNLVNTYQSTPPIYDCFMDLIKQWGIAYKITPSGNNYIQPSFNLTLFWRSTGTGSVTITPSPDKHNESISFQNNNKWLFIPFQKYIKAHPVEGTTTQFRGALIRANNEYVISHYQSRAGSLESLSNTANGYYLWYDGLEYFHHGVSNTNYQIYQQSEVLTIAPTQYQFTSLIDTSERGSAIYNSFARFFVMDYSYSTYPSTTYIDWGVPTIIANTAVVEYKYLLQGIKLRKTISGSYNLNDTIAQYNTTTLDGRDWFINRLERNVFNNTGEFELIET